MGDSELLCQEKVPPTNIHMSDFGVWTCSGSGYLLGASIWFAGGTLQSLVNAVQLVVEIAESNLLGPELLLGFYFLRLPLLFFIF